MTFNTFCSDENNNVIEVTVICDCNPETGISNRISVYKAGFDEITETISKDWIEAFKKQAQTTNHILQVYSGKWDALTGKPIRK